MFIRKLPLSKGIAESKIVCFLNINLSIFIKKKIWKKTFMSLRILSWPNLGYFCISKNMFPWAFEFVRGTCFSIFDIDVFYAKLKFSMSNVKVYHIISIFKFLYLNKYEHFYRTYYGKVVQNHIFYNFSIICLVKILLVCLLQPVAKEIVFPWIRA